MFSRRYCLKSSANCNFCFAKTNITTDQSVHRIFAFHILFDGSRCGRLVGRIFIHKRGFEFVLQIIVGRERKTACRFSQSIEFDKLGGDVFDFLFGCFFEVLPRIRSEPIEFGRRTVFAHKTGYFMQRIDRNVQ